MNPVHHVRGTRILVVASVGFLFLVLISAVMGAEPVKVAGLPVT